MATNPKMIGSTIGADNLNTTEAMSTSAYVLLNPACVSGTNNRNCTDTSSAGQLKNESGQDLDIEILFSLSSDDSDQTARFAPMTSTDNSTYTEDTTAYAWTYLVGADPKVVVLKWRLTLAAGSWVGVGVKGDTNTNNQSYRTYVLHIRSIEGYGTPSLIGDAYSTYDNTEETTAGTTAFQVPLVTTTAAGENVGLTTDNAGALTNNTGSTLVCDVFWFGTGRKPTSTSRIYTFSIGKNTGSGFSAVDTGTSRINLAQQSQQGVFAFATVSLDDGDSIAAMFSCPSTNASWEMWSYQLHIMSRT